MTTSSAMSDGSIKFMTYNIWSCEHVAVYRRIQAIGEIIDQHEPDVIFLQEVTYYIYSLFEEAPWWQKYTKFPRLPSKEKRQKLSLSSNSKPAAPFCLLLSKLDAGNVVIPQYCYNHGGFGSSPPVFPPAGSIPSDLLSAWVYTKYRKPGAKVDWQWPHLRAATCILAGPTLSDIGCVHRRARASAILEHFDAVHQPGGNERSFVLDENVVLGGDLGWDDDLDGPLRLGNGGWVDAWQELRGGGGWTYDADANPMLKGFNLPAARRRPDRFICKLRDFKLGSIQMLGVGRILDVIGFDNKGDSVPVLPSHHFGLLLTINPK